MKTQTMKTNRLWGMAIVAVLLFAVVGVIPVAADNQWSEGDVFHNTNITPTNGIRFNDYNDGKYWFSMPNGTGGMNAIHISNSYTATSGQCTNTSAKAGTFYITDTGGRGYQDDILLLVGVSGTDSDLDNFAINITASGYQWDPVYGLNTPPPAGVPTWSPTAVKQVFTKSNYLTNSNGAIQQYWKFAPLQDYPQWCGQNIASGTDTYNMTLIDLKVGTIPNSSLNNGGMVKVNYSIDSTLSSSGLVTFNTYAYNNWTSQGWKQVLWLNRVNDATQANTGCSGWLVTG